MAKESLPQSKFRALKWFSKHIRPHRFRRTILEVQFTRVVEMANEEVFGFYVLGPLRAGDITIFCEGKGTHIVLINDVGFDFVALSLKIGEAIEYPRFCRTDR